MLDNEGKKHRMEWDKRQDRRFSRKYKEDIIFTRLKQWTSCPKPRSKIADKNAKSRNRLNLTS